MYIYQLTMQGLHALHQSSIIWGKNIIHVSILLLLLLALQHRKHEKDSKVKVIYGKICVEGQKTQRPSARAKQTQIIKLKH